MSLPLFFQTDLTADTLVLNEEEARHCIRVLRMGKGDAIRLIDGKGTLAEARIEDDNPKKCLVSINARKTFPPARNYRHHIAIAPTKSFDRIEWFIEKAVEIGIDEITFLDCKNSERTKINHERCLKIAVSALKQSQQLYLPALHDLISFSAFVKQESDETKLIATCTETSKNLYDAVPPQNASVRLLIGPEGDFTPEEITLAQANGYENISMGTNRLRTETAAIFAVAAVKTLCRSL